MIKKILFVLVLFVAYLGISYALQPKLREVLRAPVPEVKKVVESTPAASNKGVETVSYNCERGKSAYEGLVKETNNRLETKDYSFGKMVNAINNIKGGTDNKYWIYFVDGKSASVSADNYRCLGQEKVEWKLTKTE